MSPKVKLHLLNMFRLELKIQYLEYEGETVGDIITKFERDYLDALSDQLKDKERKHLSDEILILLNGSNIKNLEGFRTSVNENDELCLSVPIIGG
ncbi:MAG: hypothetical protein ACTSXP_12700 [Promethearchaeota archaeon]